MRACTAVGPAQCATSPRRLLQARSKSQPLGVVGQLCGVSWLFGVACGGRGIFRHVQLRPRRSPFPQHRARGPVRVIGGCSCRRFLLSGPKHLRPARSCCVDFLGRGNAHARVRRRLWPVTRGRCLRRRDIGISCPPAAKPEGNGTEHDSCSSRSCCSKWLQRETAAEKRIGTDS